MNLISHGSQMYQSLDLIVNVYICLSFKIFYNGEVKGYQISRSQNQDLILKDTEEINHPNEDLSKLLIHSDQGILYQSPNIVITLRNHHLLNP